MDHLYPLSPTYSNLPIQENRVWAMILLYNSSLNQLREIVHCTCLSWFFIILKTNIPKIR